MCVIMYVLWVRVWWVHIHVCVYCAYSLVKAFLAYWLSTFFGVRLHNLCTLRKSYKTWVCRLLADENSYLLSNKTKKISAAVLVESTVYKLYWLNVLKEQKTWNNLWTSITGIFPQFMQGFNIKFIKYC